MVGTQQQGCLVKKNIQETNGRGGGGGGGGGGGFRGVSESVKKGKFVTKVFLQVMHYLEKNLSQILNEVEVM